MSPTSTDTGVFTVVYLASVLVPFFKFVTSTKGALLWLTAVPLTFVINFCKLKSKAFPITCTFSKSSSSSLPW